MEKVHHSLSNLFEQLGLPAERSAIDKFIGVNGALPSSVALADAPCWSASQAAFLREELQEDGDWAEVVDELNNRLHA